MSLPLHGPGSVTFCRHFRSRHENFHAAVEFAAFCAGLLAERTPLADRTRADPLWRDSSGDEGVTNRPHAPLLEPPIAFAGEGRRLIAVRVEGDDHQWVAIHPRDQASDLRRALRLDLDSVQLERDVFRRFPAFDHDRCGRDELDRRRDRPAPPGRAPTTRRSRRAGGARRPRGSWRSGGTRRSLGARRSRRTGRACR